MGDNLLRQLPGVDRLLAHPEVGGIIASFGRPLTVEAVRTVLEATRSSLRSGQGIPPDEDDLVRQIEGVLAGWLAPTLRRVINATGVIVHTNLGRAPLSDEALDSLHEIGGGYSTLEYDLGEGVRGSRSLHAESLIRRLTGAEAAFVVNNNAAAVLLALTALAGRTVDFPEGRAVVISRGELVEIGGGFRMPDVMDQSGARLVEVGTTNRTHLRDYAAALGRCQPALVMRAHRSNFAIIGFTTEPSLSELADLAHQYGVPLIDDLGSGALIDASDFGLKPEPTVQASLAAGADLVMFSGDKLLGGPQAGILAGKAELVAQVRQHPLARAVRPDKLCLAALTTTLMHYLKDEALDRVPVWRMISRSLGEIDAQVRRWADKLASAGLPCELVDSQSVVGGGSLPGETLPTRALAISLKSSDEAARRLREHNPPVIVRREDERLIVDPRTVLPREEDDLLSALLILNQTST